MARKKKLKTGLIKLLRLASRVGMLAAVMLEMATLTLCSWRNVCHDGLGVINVTSPNLLYIWNK